MSSFERILVPTDGSDAARNAADVGCELASKNNGELIFLGVADISLATSNSYIASVQVGDNIGLLKEEVEDDVEELAEHARNIAEQTRGSGLTVETVVKDGIPNETIVAFAENNEIDLIIMGTHGRRGIERFLMGSVTEKVMQTATMPVMRVRSEE